MIGRRGEIAIWRKGDQALADPPSRASPFLPDPARKQILAIVRVAAQDYEHGRVCRG